MSDQEDKIAIELDRVLEFIETERLEFLAHLYLVQFDELLRPVPDDLPLPSRLKRQEINKLINKLRTLADTPEKSAALKEVVHSRFTAKYTSDVDDRIKELLKPIEDLTE